MLVILLMASLNLIAYSRSEHLSEQNKHETYEPRNQKYKGNNMNNLTLVKNIILNVATRD